MYNEKVVEIFKNPQHVGEIKGASGIGTVGNEACGDIMKLYLKIDDNDIITDASFKTFGCAAAIVSSSVACDLIIGKPVEEALKIQNQQILDILGGLPSHKIHCSVLAKEALEAAVKDYRKKQLRNKQKEQEAPKTEKEEAKKPTKVVKEETKKVAKAEPKKVEVKVETPEKKAPAKKAATTKSKREPQTTTQTTKTAEVKPVKAQSKAVKQTAIAAKQLPTATETKPSISDLRARLDKTKQQKAQAAEKAPDKASVRASRLDNLLKSSNKLLADKNKK